MPNANPRQIREEITAKIIAALEKDLLPWRRPWASNNAGQHSNALTKKAYRGVNPLLLQIHAALFGFTSNWWATFNQWKNSAAPSIAAPITSRQANGEPSGCLHPRDQEGRRA